MIGDGGWLSDEERFKAHWKRVAFLTDDQADQKWAELWTLAAIAQAVEARRDLTPEEKKRVMVEKQVDVVKRR